MVSRKELAAADVPISKITVYRDRAEILRTLKFAVDKPGDHELILRGLPPSMKSESICVDGRGHGVILQTNLKKSAAESKDDDARTVKQKELNAEYEQVLQMINGETMEKARLEKQLEFWNKCLESISSQEVFTAKVGNASDTTYQDLTAFITTYGEQVAKIQLLLQDKQAQLYELNKQLSEIGNRRNEAQMPNQSQHFFPKQEKTRWDLVVLLEATKPGEQELTFSYIVKGAQWEPKYDIRVSTEHGTMKVMYYGTIRQATGEDWSDVTLHLSTAVPTSSHATLPKLGTYHLSLTSRPPHSFQTAATTQMAFGANQFPTGQMYAQQNAASTFGFRPPATSPAIGSDNYFNVPSAQTMAFGATSAAVPTGGAHETIQVQEIPDMEIPSAQIKVGGESGITTCFKIPRQSTIPGDGLEHKVSIGVLNLAPVFKRKIAAKKMEAVFLEVTACNTSPYTMLPGPASLFLGNDMIGMVNVPAVDVQGDISCSLGIDTSIKVRYHPVSLKKTPVGLAWIIEKRHIQVDVSSSRDDDVKLTFMEQIPYSTDENLKVTILEPEQLPSDFDSRCPLELEDTLPAQGKLSKHIKYQLEYPAGATLYVREVESDPRNNSLPPQTV